MRKILCSILVLVAALVVLSAPAGAGPPMPAAGSYSYQLKFDPSRARVAGPNRFADFGGSTAVLSGTFTGTVSTPDDPFVVFHADGSDQLSARLVFDGTVA